VVRFTDIMRKYILYHSWRRYARQANFETQLKEKGRIEGAYILLKRFKNRLKHFDSTFKTITDQKADLKEF